MSDQVTICFLEHVLWEPDEAWDDALEHVAGRFARANPLDLEAIRSAGAFHEQVALLHAWASDAGVDLDRELGRWFDEHLAMHVRPAPTVTRAVRALAAQGTVHLASALPPRPAESIARHAGCWRSIAELHAELRDSAAVASMLAQVAPERVVAAAPTPLPAGVAAAPLA